MEFTATTVKKDFIYQIINDEICVPSKEMRKIFNNEWAHVNILILEDEIRKGNANIFLKK